MTFAANPKPEPYRLTRARRRRAQAKARKTCRTARYALAGGCCEECGVPLTLDVNSARSWIEVAHCHEVVPRSLGGSPTDLENTKIYCPKCHFEAHS